MDFSEKLCCFYFLCYCLYTPKEPKYTPKCLKSSLPQHPIRAAERILLQNLSLCTFSYLVSYKYSVLGNFLLFQFYKDVLEVGELAKLGIYDFMYNIKRCLLIILCSTLQ